LLELNDNCLLLFRPFFLISDFNSNLIDLALHAAQLSSMLLQLSTLVFEIFFKLEQLIFEVVNLLFLGLQTLLHLLGSVREHVL